ncbi:23S rRNA (uracil(1939)-C(5))-methyltransferase RlmD [Vallitalea okinawensis]|uniref:23S rRNA (uracil(1939)-C(5))-methyltransferase RlmD n=1 Tax=Vallitalea okinawensis TaxID=2078660 RepID=UPI000CFBB1CF|nr:23S rRNA (uracil(1939)-C(5))-methyltransferase RlmD [Vallitalea okinawensis]
MKKNSIIEGVIAKVNFPNKGILEVEDKKVVIKGVVKGQKVKVRITKKRKSKIEGRIVEILERAENEIKPACIHFDGCGGCVYQNLSYEDQVKMKEEQVKELIDELGVDYEFLPIVSSPTEWEYRNKMEYSFGDEIKDGPLMLGMHKKGSFYDIVTVDHCLIVHEDFNKILTCTLEYFKEKGTSYYRKRNHEGTLRHLVVRRAVNTKEILVNLITSSQEELILDDYVKHLTSLNLDGEIVGILQTINDSLADVVKCDELKLLHGRDYFTEDLLDLNFKISPFSFFQTNSLGAEVLYSKVREFVGEGKDKTIFDLYCGTGTIAQIMSPIAKKVMGIEIVEEAVEAAKMNAERNGLTNCEFIAGDVLKAIDQLKDKPDIIILDPPRDGIHPKALKKIIDFGAKELVYVSCKPTSLARDLEVLLENGYVLEKAQCVDMFPQTPHVETVVRLCRQNF